MNASVDIKLNQYIFHFNNCCWSKTGKRKKNVGKGVKNVTLNFIVFIMAPTVEVFYSKKMSENWKFLQKLFY